MERRLKELARLTTVLVVPMRTMDFESTLFSVQPWRGRKARTPNLMSHDVGSRQQYGLADSQRRQGKARQNILLPVSLRIMRHLLQRFSRSFKVGEGLTLIYQSLKKTSFTIPFTASLPLCRSAVTWKNVVWSDDHRRHGLIASTNLLSLSYRIFMTYQNISDFLESHRSFREFLNSYHCNRS